MENNNSSQFHNGSRARCSSERLRRKAALFTAAASLAAAAAASPALPLLRAEAEAGDYLVVSDEYGVYVRSAPSDDAEIVGSLAQGQIALVREDDGGDWVLLYGGYVKREYMDVINYEETGAGTKDPDPRSEEDVKDSGDNIFYSEGGEAKEGEKEASEEASEEGSDGASENNNSESGTSEDGASESEAGNSEGSQESEGSEDSEESENSEESEEDDTEYATTWDEEMGQAVADYALQFVGLPYVWGGESLETGADCSGFTRAIYAHFDVDLPHYDVYQRSCGLEVKSVTDAKPGDLVFYKNHVTIYIGNDQVVNCSTEELGTLITRVDYRAVEMVRRIFY